MYDYLIIGQGLAGTILSYHLIKQGNKVLVINHHDPQSSSYIAAGIFSPIAGQRLAKIWQADKAIAHAQTFYPELEKALNTRFFYPMPYVKLLINEKLRTQAQTRLQDPAYQALLQPTIYNNHDAMTIANAGYVDTVTLLDRYRTYLQHLNAYRQEKFDEQHLTIGKRITYKDITAKRLIYANGLQACNNSYFNHLRFYPTKGELLTIHADMKLNHIIGGNVFVLPIGNNLFHVGATFQRDYRDALPTQQAREWLTNELQKLIDCPYEIIEHKVGIRPTTPGHRPFVEWHNTHTNIGIFSGFGSKGVSFAPYMAHELISDYMCI